MECLVKKQDCLRNSWLPPNPVYMVSCLTLLISKIEHRTKKDWQLLLPTIPALQAGNPFFPFRIGSSRWKANMCWTVWIFGLSVTSLLLPISSPARPALALQPSGLWLGFYLTALFNTNGLFFFLVKTSGYFREMLSFYHLQMQTYPFVSSLPTTFQLFSIFPFFWRTGDGVTIVQLYFPKTLSIPLFLLFIIVCLCV